MARSDFDWAMGQPESLLKQCISYCMNHLDSFTVPVETDMIDDTPIRRLKPGLVLPANLSNKILEYMAFNIDPSWFASYETLLHIFEDAKRTQLSRVQFRNDVGLTGPCLTHILARHPVQELDIPACGMESSADGKAVFSCINAIGPALRILKVRLRHGCYHCVTEFLPRASMAFRDRDRIDGLTPTFTKFTCCNLQALVLKNFTFHDFEHAQELDGFVQLRFAEEFLEGLFDACGSSLRHLDLSGCSLSLNHLEPIAKLENLISLVLADVMFDESTSFGEVADKICNVRTLRCVYVIFTKKIIMINHHLYQQQQQQQQQ
jgi:hypothetical protein